MTVTDRIAAWEAKQRARLAWAEREVERAYREKIAARDWADKCVNKLRRLEEYIERLEHFREVSQDDEVILAKLVLARNDARRAWINVVRADFRMKRADIRLRRATLVRDETSFNLGGR